ncbi:MAG TPA: DUF4032 domain-containing protein [Jiangellales bacterium]|nr:DUF4032 domain-containing protein [Jiangellales bacterium]
MKHRWFLSEAAGHDLGTTAACADYFAQVLPTGPDDLTITVAHHTPAPRRDGGS